MIFQDFIKNEEVRKTSLDKSLIMSLVKTAKKGLEFLDDLEINEKSSRKALVGYCDVLRSILEAISLLDGYKIYSHEAFTYFLKYKKEPILAIKFDRFRKIRNSVNYYGQDISIEESKENIGEIKKIIKFLIREKSKPLLLSRGRRNEGDVFFPAAENLSEDFLCPKIPERNFLVSKTSNKPTPLDVGKLQEVFN